MALVDIAIPSEAQEGTTMKVQAWLKQPGDSVAKYEPLVEMETDKVTLEIEAPVDGVLSEILVSPNDDVIPSMIIGRIDTEKSLGQASDQKKLPKENDAVKLSLAPSSAEQADVIDDNATGATNQLIKNRALSPSVRRFVMQHEIDVFQVLGTGRRNRITLNDVKKHFENQGNLNAVDSKPVGGDALPSVGRSTASRHIAHTSMRRSIAKHMSASVNEAPHVTAVFEADFSAIIAHRTKHKDDFASRGVKLTYTAYMLLACAEAMKAVPEINSRWHADSIEVFSDVNIGVGTALGDKGLVVPVINGVQEKSLFGVAKELQDTSQRARDNKLTPSDVRGGTFTISNHGVSGSLIATPIIINQPQSAILGVGKLEKRVVVKTLDDQDVMLIKPMAYVSLTIDHRVIDGHQTNSWLAAFVSTLENWSS